MGIWSGNRERERDTWHTHTRIFLYIYIYLYRRCIDIVIFRGTILPLFFLFTFWFPVFLLFFSAVLPSAFLLLRLSAFPFLPFVFLLFVLLRLCSFASAFLLACLSAFAVFSFAYSASAVLLARYRYDGRIRIYIPTYIHTYLPPTYLHTEHIRAYRHTGAQTQI